MSCNLRGIFKYQSKDEIVKVAAGPIRQKEKFARKEDVKTDAMEFLF